MTCKLTNTSDMFAERDAPASINSSSFDGGVGGASNGIVLGDDRTPTDDPASPRRLAARRSPDRLRSIRLKVGVELRLLALEYERSSSGSLYWLLLLLDRLLITLGDRRSTDVCLELFRFKGRSVLTELWPSSIADPIERSGNSSGRGVALV